jgi:S-adenosylmethionine-diacylglycerol 3-amino-3-carboxypropyl transferase
VSFISHLQSCADKSFDAYVLLDAQDWMTDDDLTLLWREITRTAKPGARVIFRTAADERLLPGRVPSEILASWHYNEAYCRDLTRRDRSSIYGGFHLYRLAQSA